LLCGLCMAVVAGWSQQRYVLQFHAVDTVLAKGLKTQFASKALALQYVAQLPAQLLGKGYLAASVDSVAADSSMAQVWLYQGPQYRWQELRMDSVATYWWQHAGGNSQQATAWSPDSIQRKLVAHLADVGYPFAYASWDSVQLQQQWISGLLHLHTGPLYKIDSIQQTGKPRLRPNYLYKYLNMQPGMPYSQQTIDATDARLNELLFAQPAQPSQLQMLGTGSVLQVQLQPRRSNVINVLLGVMPQSVQTPDSKAMITGDVQILLRNAFAGGETLGINWQQLQYKSPRINLQYEQPFVWAKAGVETKFDLLKKDTQFLNLQFRLGIPYQIDRYQTGKVFYLLQQNTVGFADTNRIKQTLALPDIADFSIHHIGAEWGYNNTDYRFNPRRGTQVLLTAMAGIKRIRQNNEVVSIQDRNRPGFKYASLYDTVKMKTHQLRLKAQLARFFSLGNFSVLKTCLQAGWLQSGSYYRNELFQIGGNKLLRGFDEESIYASDYAVATVEYRYLTGQNSFLFAFSDFGTAAYKDQTRSFRHQYWGAGLGLNLETRNSQVNISWAVGQRHDQPLNLRQSKIHIGFVNFF